MRSMKLSFTVSALVFTFAATAFAQDEAPADDATAVPTDATAEPAAAPEESAPADTTASVTTNDASTGGKFVVGLRLGYAIAMGDAAEDQKLSDGISGHVPIWLDLGYMVTPNIMVGLYGHYGIGIPAADECDIDGVDCSASIIRLGIQGQYHLSPAEKLDPWFGLGIGYEWASMTAEGGGEEVTYNYSGFEFLNLQAGLDYKASPALGIGPFLSFSLGQYDSYSFESPTGDSDGDIEEKGMHEWLTLGVRGAFSL